MRLLIAAATCLWGVLWWSGAPFPHEDDLFFVGAALEHVKTGDLHNPLITRWDPDGPHRFLYQPPAYQFALAAWLRLFGVSTASLTALPCLAGLIASIALGIVVRRFGWRGAWLMPLACAGFGVQMGLRHDMLGLALLSVGLAGVWSRSFAGRVLAFACLWQSAFTWPILGVYAGVFGIGVTVVRLRQLRESPWAYLAPAGLAAILVIAVFLVMLDGHTGAFVDRMAWHAALRRWSEPVAMWWSWLVWGWRPLTHWPMLIALAVLTARAWRHRRTHPGLAVLAASLFAVLGVTLLLYTDAWFTFGEFVALPVVGLLLVNLPSRMPRWVTAGAALCLMALMYSSAILTLTLVRPLPPETYRAMARAVPSDRCLVVDGTAARYVFDYHLPPCAVDVLSVSPQGTPRAQVLDGLRAFVAVLSPDWLESRFGIGSSTPTVIAGRALVSIPQDKYAVTIVDLAEYAGGESPR